MQQITHYINTMKRFGRSSAKKFRTDSAAKLRFFSKKVVIDWAQAATLVYH